MPDCKYSGCHLAGRHDTLAIEIAAKSGLCVVGFVRGGKMNIYTHPERVQGAPSLPQ